MNAPAEQLQIRVFGDATLPTLIHLPGLHGDWTLITSFRVALQGRARFVEFTYPRSLTWSVAEYADAIQNALLAQGITHGWLIGESFGSQFAWELTARNPTPSSRFKVDGIILAAGFVKHPWKRGARLMRWLGEKTPRRNYELGIKLYAWYSRFRHRHAPETRDSIQEFVARRTGLDREAMRARLVLLDQYDPRPIARQTRVPVYYVNGSVDPLVQWLIVRRWLRRHCPGYCGGKTFWLADHNVLATAPRPAASLILSWLANHPTKMNS